MTRVDLNILPGKDDQAKENVETHAFFRNMMEKERVLTSTLLIEGEGPYGFIPLFTNSFKSFNPTDSTFRTKEVGENFIGHKQILAGSPIDSFVGGEISITYDERKGLPITKLHKVWFDYIEHVRMGT